MEAPGSLIGGRGYFGEALDRILDRHLDETIFRFLVAGRGSLHGELRAEFALQGLVGIAPHRHANLHREPVRARSERFDARLQEVASEALLLDDAARGGGALALGSDGVSAERQKLLLHRRADEL